MKAADLDGGRRPPLCLDNYGLVVFDVDGTLYNQARLRAEMAMRLLSHLVSTGRLSTLKALKAYRRMRETTAEAGDPDFEDRALAAAACAGGISEARAREVVAEWMHQRPLPLLARCRYAGVSEIFAELRRKGILVGIFSDYPAAAKIKAMSLEADVMAFAGGVGSPLQKPDPGGLKHLMEITNTPPRRTILIGDRDERDGEAGRRAGVEVLIRTDKPTEGNMFRDFSSLLEPEPAAR